MTRHHVLAAALSLAALSSANAQTLGTAAPASGRGGTYPTSGKGTVVLRAARLIDGTGAAEVHNGVVVITDDRIVAVGRDGAVAVPQGAKVVDLGDATLLPASSTSTRTSSGARSATRPATTPPCATTTASARSSASRTRARR